MCDGSFVSNIDQIGHLFKCTGNKVLFKLNKTKEHLSTSVILWASYFFTSYGAE